MKTLELTNEEAEIIKNLRLKNKEQAKLWEPKRTLESYSVKEKQDLFDSMFWLATKELERVKFKENTSKGERDIYFWFMKILGERVFLDCIDHIDLKGSC